MFTLLIPSNIVALLFSLICNHSQLMLSLNRCLLCNLHVSLLGKKGSKLATSLSPLVYYVIQIFSYVITIGKEKFDFAPSSSPLLYYMIQFFSYITTTKVRCTCCSFRDQNSKLERKSVKGIACRRIRLW